MARGNDNGNRRKPRASKPYDVSNSFIRRITSGVSNFIPGSSWLNNFLQRGQTETIQNDDVSEHDSEEETEQRPSASQRIPLDTEFTSSAFEVESRLHETETPEYRRTQSSKHVLETATDIASGTHCTDTLTSPCAASTPTVSQSLSIPLRTFETTSRNLQHTPLGRINGDNRSETSESASGSSSFFARNGSVERSSNTRSSSLTIKRQRMEDITSSTRQLQSPRAMLLHRMRNQRLMSPALRKQPTFNVDAFLSPNKSVDSPTLRSSPLYPGPTFFGGASSVRRPQAFPMLKLDATKKPSNYSTNSHISVAAKHILETLEKWSSPVMDAKRIPVNEVSHSASKRQRLLSSTETSSGPPRTSLVIPTTPELLKWKNREKLQDSREAASRLAGSYVSSNLSEMQREYSLRADTDQKDRRPGKTKGNKIKDEDTVRPVNLPNIALPISTLPTFTEASLSVSTACPQATSCTTNFTTVKSVCVPTTSVTFTPSVSKSNEKIPVTSTTVSDVNRKSCLNTFSFGNNTSEATVISSASKNDTISKTTKEMTFSFHSNVVPQSMTSGTTKTHTVDSKLVVTSTSTSIPHWAQFTCASNNISQASSSQEKLVSPSFLVKNSSSIDEISKNESKSGGEKHIFKFASPIVKNPNIETPNKVHNFVLCNPINSKNNVLHPKVVVLQEDKSVLPTLEEKAPESPEVITKRFKFRTDRKTTSLKVQEQHSVFAPKPSASETFEQGVKNKNSSRASVTKCSACSRLNESDKTTCSYCNKTLQKLPSSKETLSKDISHDSQTCIKSSFTEKFKPSSNRTWECNTCHVKNSDAREDCESCGISKIKTNVKSSANTQGFGDMFKKPVGSWECSTCMVSNKSEAVKCVACETPKPALKPSGFGDMFKKPVGSWECPSCMVSNKSEAAKCVACETPKPNGGFGDMFKKPAGSWECSTCMVSNKSEAVKCVACETPKSGEIISQPSTNALPATKFNIDIPPEASNFKFGIDKANSANPPEVSFKFGGEKVATTVDDSSVSVTKTTEFKFGLPTTLPVNSSFTFGFGNHVTSSSNSAGLPSIKDSLTYSTTSAFTKTSSENKEFNVDQKQQGSLEPSDFKSGDVFKIPKADGAHKKLSQTKVADTDDKKQSLSRNRSADIGTVDATPFKTNVNINSTVAISSTTSLAKSRKDANSNSVNKVAFTFDPSKTVFGNVSTTPAVSSVGSELKPNFSFISEDTPKTAMTPKFEASSNQSLENKCIKPSISKADPFILNTAASQTVTSTTFKTSSEKSFVAQTTSSSDLAAPANTFTFVGSSSNPLNTNSNCFQVVKSDTDNPFSKISNPFQTAQSSLLSADNQNSEQSEPKKVSFGTGTSTSNVPTFCGFPNATGFAVSTPAVPPSSCLATNDSVKPITSATVPTFGASQSPAGVFTPGNEFKLFSQPAATQSSTPFVFGSSNNTNVPPSLFSFGSKSGTTDSQKPFAFGAQTQAPVSVPSFSSSQPTASLFSFGSTSSSATPFQNPAATGNASSTQPSTLFGNTPSLFGATGFTPNSAVSSSATSGLFNFSGNQAAQPSSSTLSGTFSFGQTQSPAIPKFDPDAKPTFNFSHGETPEFKAHSESSGIPAAPNTNTQRIIKRAHRRKPIR